MKGVEKSHLTQRGDISNQAAGRRFKAARKMVGLSQVQLAERISRSDTTVIAIEKGRQLPTWPQMAWFFENHRVDFNYFINGEFAQLPGDVQIGLFATLTELPIDSADPKRF